jgi:hypothetical protein
MLRHCNCVTACCTIDKSTQVSANSRLYFKLRGENPREFQEIPTLSLSNYAERQKISRVTANNSFRQN